MTVQIGMSSAVSNTSAPVLPAPAVPPVRDASPQPQPSAGNPDGISSGSTAAAGEAVTPGTADKADRATAIAPEPDPDDPAEQRARELAQKLVDDVVKPYVKLEVTRNEESGNFSYKTVDERTGEVLREWPPEKLMDEVGADAVAALVVDKQV